MKTAFVTGIPRSGTSLIASIIKTAGYHTGPTAQGNRNNPEGFLENVGVRKEIIKPYLVNNGYDRMGQNPIPLTQDLPPFPKGTREKFFRIIGARDNILFKEPKLSLVWRPWSQMFPDASWVIVRRRDEDILRSVQNTSFMRAYKTIEGWKQWLHIHKTHLSLLKEELDAWEVWPEDLFEDEEESVLFELESFLGVEIPREEALRLVKPKLWNRNA